MDDSQGDRAVIGMLEHMGCGISSDSSTTEKRSVTIRGGELRGVELDLNATPDALPALAVTACFAEGETRLINVPQAREKETDRIAAMTEILSSLGADIEELEDGLVIRGRGRSGDAGKPALTGGEVDGLGDHRIVMALSIAALGADGPITITTAEAADITFPGFFDLLEQVRVSR